MVYVSMLSVAVGVYVCCVPDIVNVAVNILNLYYCSVIVVVIVIYVMSVKFMVLLL